MMVFDEGGGFGCHSAKEKQINSEMWKQEEAGHLLESECEKKTNIQ